MIASVALVPRRLAPASTIACASSALWIPPEAFTPISGPTVFLIRATSAAFAPPVENPVEVFTKSAPASFASSHAFTFSSSVKKAGLDDDFQNDVLAAYFFLRSGYRSVRSRICRL